MGGQRPERGALWLHSGIRTPSARYQRGTSLRAARSQRGPNEVPTRWDLVATSLRARCDLVVTSLGRGEVPHWDLARYLILRSRRGTSFVPFRCVAGALRSCSACAPHTHASAGAQKRRTFACMRARQARANIKSKPLYPLHAPPSRRASQPRCRRVAYSPTWLMSVAFVPFAEHRDAYFCKTAAARGRCNSQGMLGAA